jgi:hypothetical protein
MTYTGDYHVLPEHGVLLIRHEYVSNTSSSNPLLLRNVLLAKTDNWLQVIPPEGRMAHVCCREQYISKIMYSVLHRAQAQRRPLPSQMKIFGCTAPTDRTHRCDDAK